MRGVWQKGIVLGYYCAKCGYFLDAVCAKTAINGLRSPGIVVPARQSKFRTAARLATKAGQFFVSSLVESIGEAVAGVILDNATRDFNPHGGHDNRTDDGDNGH